ncbi:MAG: HAD family phosphatase [Armatimonadetes bacterium]|nr:HAD family phosphatase [Armatimonadota bacterium]
MSHASEIPFQRHGIAEYNFEGDGATTPHTMIKLVAIDIDGTLLNSSRQVSEENKSALKAVQEAGITICLASGRLIPTIMPIAEEAGVSGPMITCNGAYAESAEGETLVSATLSKRAQQEVLDYSRENQVTANLYQPRRVLTTHESPYLELYVKRTRAQPEVFGWDRLEQEAATKMIFVDAPAANLSHAEYFEPLQEYLDFDLTVSEPEYLEFLPRGMNKGTTLALLAKHMGLRQDEVAAIGDYHNDFDMIQWAGLGAAMGSAPEEVKAVANMVVPTNDENGVAFFLNHILNCS